MVWHVNNYEKWYPYQGCNNLVTRLQGGNKAVTTF